MATAEEVSKLVFGELKLRDDRIAELEAGVIDPPPPTGNESPDKKVVNGPGDEIIDKAGVRYQIVGADRRIAVNGGLAMHGAGVRQLVYRKGEGFPPGGQVSHEDANGNWYSVPSDGTSGSSVANPLGETITPPPPDQGGGLGVNPKGTKRIFGSQALVNTPLGPTPPIHPQNAALAARFAKSGSAFGLNLGAWNAVILFADASTPRLAKIGPQGGGWIAEDVPNPPGAHGSRELKDSDGLLCIVDTTPGKEAVWDFFRAQQGIAGSEGYNKKHLNGSGIYDGRIGPWAGHSSCTSNCWGLVRKEEIDKGELLHAIAIGMGAGHLKSSAALPVVTSDGTVHDADALPNGTWLQLDPGLDVGSLGLNRECSLIAKAMQDFGLMVSERTGGAVPIYFQCDEMGKAGWSWGDYNFSGLSSGPAAAKIFKSMRVIAPRGEPLDSPKTWTPPMPHK